MSRATRARATKVAMARRPGSAGCFISHATLVALDRRPGSAGCFIRPATFGPGTVALDSPAACAGHAASVVQWPGAGSGHLA